MPRELSVLIVDADDDTRCLYREALERAGCLVVEAVDGRDALVKALAQQPAVIVTETSLPMVDGCSLCEILRHDDATRTVPIVVVTADARPQVLERARLAGASIVLVKPTAMDILVDEVRRQAERRVHAEAGGPAPAMFGGAPAVLDHRDAAERSRRPLSKVHARGVTTTPSASPPALHCPVCNAGLAYQFSHIGGVSARHPEQWDYYACPSLCGTFEYRQRTRKLRAVKDQGSPFIR